MTWRAPAECPDAGWAEQRIRERLAQPTRAAWPGGVGADVVIAPQPAGYRLVLETRTHQARGARTLEGADCRQLADAATLVIALSLTQAEPEPPEQVVDAAPPASEVTRATTPERTARRFGDGTLRAGILMDLGWLPQTSWAPSLALGYASQRLWFELSGLWFPPRTAGGREDGRVRAQLLAAGALGCGAATRAGYGLQLWLCLGLEVGRWAGQGLDFPEVQQVHGAWLASAFGPRLSFRPLRRFGLLLDPLGALVFRRPRFLAVEAERNQRVVVHQPSQLALRIVLSAQWRF